MASLNDSFFRFSACLCATALAAPQLVRADGRDLGRVMPLGDSITQGFPTDGDSGYRQRLQQLLLADGYGFDFVGSLTVDNPSVDPFAGFDPDHAGYSGYHIINDPTPGVRDLAGVAAGGDVSLAQRELALHAPEVVLLHVGINDLLNDDSERNAVEQYATLLDQVRLSAPAARVIVASTIAANQKGTSLLNRGVQNQVRRRAAEGSLLEYAGGMSRAVGRAERRDGVHPTDDGYGRMAEVWFDAVVADAPEPASRQFDFAAAGPFERTFYNTAPNRNDPTGRPNLAFVGVEVDQPGSDGNPGVLAFNARQKGQSARVMWNPETVETNLLGDVTIAADVKATSGFHDDSTEGVDGRVSLLARVGLDDLGAADTGGYRLDLIIDDKVGPTQTSQDRLSLHKVGTGELAFVLVPDGSLLQDEFYRLRFDVRNDATGVELIGQVFQVDGNDQPPVVSLRFHDAASPFSTAGQVGIEFASGAVGGTDWRVDALRVVPEPAALAPLCLSGVMMLSRYRGRAGSRGHS